MSTPLKRCSLCVQEFPATSEYFSSDKSRPDGLFGQCKTCRNKRQRERRAAHPERYTVYSRRRYLKDPAAVKRRVLEWQRTAKGRKAKKDYRRRNIVQHQIHNRRHYEANREKLIERTKKWQVQNPERFRANQERRDRRKRSRPIDFTEMDWQFAIDYFSGCCAACGRPFDTESHKAVVDHWIPLASAACPGTIPTNIVPLCHGRDGCNNHKHDRDAIEWLTFQFGTHQAQQIMTRIQDFFSLVRQIK